MRVVVDIRSADLVIPSIECTYSRGLLKYNSSRSATYEADGTELDLGRLGAGFVSRDTLTIGSDIRISHHPFLEANRTGSGFSQLGYDTIFGLAIDEPGYLDSPHHLPSPFATLIQEKTLDRNVASLLLPMDDDDVGDLMFGDLEEALYEGP